MTHTCNPSPAQARSMAGYVLVLAAAMASQGCGNAPGNDQKPEAGKGPAPVAAEAMESPPVAPQLKVEMSSVMLSKVVNGVASPLAAGKLGPGDGLKVTVKLTGVSKEAKVEIRVADNLGNGIQRDEKTLKINGDASVDFDVPAPADGWRAGTYLVMPVIDFIPASASSFQVR